MVVKNDGRREPFDRKKLRTGLSRACEKRPIPSPRPTRSPTKSRAASTRVGSRDLHARDRLARMERLKELDESLTSASLRSYRQFEDVGEFLDELEDPALGAPHPKGAV